MNRIAIIIIGLWILCGIACQEADKEMFDGNETGLYFELGKLKEDKTLILREDTVMYTFAYDDVEEVHQREVFIPVELAGFAAGRERTYRIEVEAAANTKEGVDYEPLAPEQVYSADKMVDSLRFVWKRNPSMQKEVKKVNIRIVSGGDFEAGVEEKLFVSLQASDILEQPAWWEAWEAAFGSWHPTKLREWIKIWGKEDLPAKLWNGPNFFEYPQECTAIVKLHDLFENEEFYDENGVRLYVPANVV